MTQLIEAIKQAAKEKRQIFETEMRQLVINHRSELYVEDNHGRTALHYAAHHGQVTAVRILLEHGLDAKKSDHVRKTPMDYVARHQWLDAKRREHYDNIHKMLSDALVPSSTAPKKRTSLWSKFKKCFACFKRQREGAEGIDHSDAAQTSAGGASASVEIHLETRRPPYVTERIEITPIEGERQAEGPNLEHKTSILTLTAL